MPPMTGAGTRCAHCERPVQARGYCRTHYERWRLGTSMDSPITPWRVNQIRDDDGNKHCIKCDQWIPVDNFQLNAKTADGLSPYCRSCARWRSRYYYWGLTPELFALILNNQDGRCPICDEQIPEADAYVDHDHSCCPGHKSCGRCIRGLLHNKCNSLLGLAKDSPEILQRAARYLAQNEMELSR